MLTRSLISKARRHPDLAICRFCNKPVDPEDSNTEYIKSKTIENFFHRDCFIREYKESIKK